MHLSILQMIIESISKIEVRSLCLFCITMNKKGDIVH